MQAKPTRRLRAACDFCHNAKMKCSGCTPCAGCANSGRECVYSFANKLGRPKGGKNKKPRRDGEDQSVYPNHVASEHLTRDACQTQWNHDEFAFQDIDIDTDVLTTATVNGKRMSWSLTSPTGELNGSQLNANLGTSLVDLAPMDFTARTPSFSELGPSVFPTDFAPFPLGRRDSSSNQPLPNSSFPPWLGSCTSTMPTQPRGFDSAVPKGCNCVQRHAKFFCRLKDADKADSISVSATLEAAKHILNLFHRSHACSTCREDDDNDAQVLLVLCIRTVLKRFRICIQSQRRSSRSSNSESRSSSDPPSGETFRSSQSGSKSSSYNVKVDNLDLSQDDQAYLVNMLVVRTVKEIKTALRALKDVGNERDKERHLGSLEAGSHQDSTAETPAWAQEGDSESGQEPEKLTRDDRFLCNAIESLCDGLKELEHSLEAVCNMSHLL